MTYIANISKPSEIWGKQVETTHKSAVLCVDYCEKPENGAVIAIVNPVTGKTLDSVVYDGESWKKPEKAKKPRKKPQKSEDYSAEQISFF